MKGFPKEYSGVPLLEWGEKKVSSKHFGIYFTGNMDESAGGGNKGGDESLAESARFF